MVSASNRIVTAPRKAKGRYEKAHFCIHSYDIDDNASEAPPASVAQDGAPESHMTEKDIREAGFVIDIFGAPLVSLEFIYTTTYFLIMLHGLTFPVWFIDLPSQYGSWTYLPIMLHDMSHKKIHLVSIWTQEKSKWPPDWSPIAATPPLHPKQ